MAARGKFTEEYNLLKDGRRVWIIQADTGDDGNGWHWDQMIDEKPHVSDWGGDNWIRSPVSRKRIREDFRPGDIAFCYQATPDKKFVGFARIASEGLTDKHGLFFRFDWWTRATGPTWEEYSSDPILAESDKTKLRVGSVFRLSPKEAARLYSMYQLSAREKAAVDKALAMPPDISKTGPGLAPRVPERQPVDLDPPDRVATTVTRVVRDTEVARRAKVDAGHACAVCGTKVVRGDGSPYSEAHHLRPLAKAHQGIDAVENILVLCPTHHAEFDFGSIAIHPSTHQIRHIDPKNAFHRKRPHNLSPRTGGEFIKYHWKKVFGGAKR